MLSKHVFFTLLSITLIFVSCNQDDLVKTKTALSFIPNVVETRLSFDSKEDLSAYLDDFKNRPYHEFKREVLELEERGFSSARILDPEIQTDKFLRKYSNIAQTRDNNIDDDIDLDEGLIADEYFASILNEDNEINVDGVIYKYTEKGLFFASEQQYSNLLSEYNNYQMGADKGESILGNGVTRFVPDPEAGDVGAWQEAPDDPPPGPPSPGPGTGGGDCEGCDFDLSQEVGQLDFCTYSSGAEIDKIFGPSYNCYDKFDHDSKKRIKTKFTAQNYLIFRTLTLKVKIQKHRRILGIGHWDKSGIHADKLQLGADVLQFEYDWAIQPGQAPMVSNYVPNQMVVQYGYTTITRNILTGQVESFGYETPQELFEGFPFADDYDIIKIYLPAPLHEMLDNLGLLPHDHDLYDIIYSLSTQDVNDYLQDLSKDAAIMLLEYLQVEVNGDVVIVEPDIDENKFRFTLVSYTKSDCEENKIFKTWDWETAEVGVSSDLQGGSGVIFNPPSNYERLIFIGHGIGKEDGCNYAGSRLALEDN